MDEPLVFTLDIRRKQSPDESHVEVIGQEDYHVYESEDNVTLAYFTWGPEIEADLKALQSTSTLDLEARGRVANELARFLKDTCWTPMAEKIVKAREQNRLVILTIRSKANEIHRLPFELLAVEGKYKFLGGFPNLCIRYELLGKRLETKPEEPNPRPEGGRILLAHSAAEDVVLTAGKHQSAISTSMAAAGWNFEPNDDVLPAVTLESLRERMRRKEGQKSIAVLHLLTHGDQDGLVFPENDKSTSKRVDAESLADLLGEHAGGLRLVILAACQSGDSQPTNSYLRSVARALHCAGIESVIAARFPLTKAGSTTFTNAFYRALLEEQASVERAFIAGREALESKSSSSNLDWACLQLYRRSADGVDARPLPFRPYRGLLPFEEHHRRFFFGREAERTELKERLQQAMNQLRPRFQLVVGASGTGKSSLVMSGVAGDLQRSDMNPTGWNVIKMRPAERQNALAALLSKLEKARPSGAGRVSSLGEGVPSVAFPTRTKTRPAMHLQFDADDKAPPSTAHALNIESRRFTNETRGEKWLIIVDQFEEIFTVVPSPDRQEFVQALIKLSHAHDASIVVLCILRVDYLARVDEIVIENSNVRQSLDRIAYNVDHTYWFTRMPPNRLRDVVIGPASRVGIRFADDLAETILRDAGEAAAASLPLLAYILDDLWSKRQNNLLTHAAYRELEGFDGALGRAANRVYNQLTPAQQLQAKIFLEAMVSAGEGERADARQRAWIDDHKPDHPEDAKEFDHALAQFEESRLIVTGKDPTDGPWAELAHDAILQQWKVLHDWIDTDRQILEEIDELRTRAQKYRENPHDPYYLIPSKSLPKAIELREKKPGALGKECLEFIDESIRAEARQIQREKEEQEQAAKAKDAAEARERQEMQRHMALAVGIIMLLTAITFVTVLYLRQSRVQAEELALYNKLLLGEQEKTDKSSKLAQMAALLATSGRLVDADATRAVVFLREIKEPDELDGFEDTALKALDKPVAEMLYELQHGSIRALQFSRDNQWLIAAGSDGIIFKVPISGGAEQQITEHQNGAQVLSLTITANGQQVISASDDKDVRIVSLDGTKREVTLAHTHPVLAVATNPKDETIATASDSAPRIFNASSSSKLPELLGTPNDPTRQVTTLAYRADGLELASGASDGKIGIHSLRGTKDARFIDVDGQVISLEYDPTGSRLLVLADADAGDNLKVGPVRLEHLDQQGKGRILANGEPAYWTAFSPTGKHIAMRNADGAVRVLPASGEGEVLTLWPKGTISRADWSRDGHVILGADQNDVLHVRRLGAPSDEATIPAACSVARLAMNDDGTRIAVGCRTGEIRVFRIQTQFLHKESLPDPSPTHRVLAASWTTSGDGFAALVQEEKRRVVRIRRSSPAEFVDAGEFSDAQNLILSPDGAYVAILRTGRGLTLLPTRTITAPRRAHEKTPSVAPIDVTDTTIQSIAFNPSGSYFVAASENAYACVYETGSLEPLRCYLHKGEVRTIKWLSNGTEFVTASTDGFARIYALAEDNPKAEFRHNEPVAMAIPSLDGKLIVTLTTRKTARVWNVDDGKFQLSQSKYEGKFVSAAVSARNILLIYNTGASLFDHALGNEKSLMLAGGTVDAAEFSPDGEFIATLSRDGATRIFRTAVGTEEKLRIRFMATLQEPSTPIQWLSWTTTPELSLLTASTNGIVQSRPMKIEDITRKLWAASAYCPSAKLRAWMLAIDDPAAELSAAQCLERIKDR